MIGIVLAGGAATRLPNKALLPIADHHIAIESAIKFCRRCDKTVIVVPNNRIIEGVLKMRSWGKLEYVVQYAPNGVSEAIAIAARHAPDRGQYLVTFCDNVYDMDERVPETQLPSASTRWIDPKLAQHLDGYDVGVWSKKHSSAACLAGWYMLSWADTQKAVPHEESVDYLNKIGAHAVTMPAALSWWDIGTPDSYAAYLGSIA